MGIIFYVTESQGVELSNGPSTHGKDVAVDTPHPCCCTLVRLDRARMVVTFDLESAGPAIADIHQASVLLTRFHQQIGARTRQGFQQADRVLVGTMLAPHGTVDAEFREVGNTAHDLDDLLILLFHQAELPGGFERSRQVLDTGLLCALGGGLRLGSHVSPHCTLMRRGAGSQRKRS